MASGGGEATVSRVTAEREREHRDKNLLSVVRESVGSQILVRRT
jgi:hypothetical protein